MANSTVRSFVVFGTLLGLIAGSACSIGPSAVTSADIQNQISSRPREASGHKPELVRCPNGLTASIGVATDCQLQVKGNLYNATVTVTSVDSGQATLDIAQTVDKGQIASEIGDRFSQQLGHDPDLVRCPHGLQGDVGATLRCELRDRGQTYGASITVTSVDGGDVKFDIKVDDSPTQ